MSFIALKSLIKCGRIETDLQLRTSDGLLYFKTRLIEYIFENVGKSPSSNEILKNK